MPRGKRSRSRRVYMRARRRYRRPGFKLPLAIVSGFIPLGVGMWNRRTQPGQIGPYVLGSLTGYVPGVGWSTQYMSEGALPILGGFIAHWVASRIGINRALGRAGIPIFRI